MTSKMRRIMEQIAAQEHTTPEEVYQDIQNTIDGAFSDPDPSIRAAWNNYFPSGKKPTPEEFIIKMAKIIRK